MQYGSHGGMLLALSSVSCNSARAGHRSFGAMPTANADGQRRRTTTPPEHSIENVVGEARLLVTRPIDAAPSASSDRRSPLVRSTQPPRPIDAAPSASSDRRSPLGVRRQHAPMCRKKSRSAGSPTSSSLGRHDGPNTAASRRHASPNGWPSSGTSSSIAEPSQICSTLLRGSMPDSDLVGASAGSSSAPCRIFPFFQ